MQENRTQYLLQAYIRSTLTTAEREEFWNLVQNGAAEERLEEALQSYLASLPSDTTLEKEPLQYIWKNAVSVDKKVPETKVVSLTGRRWWRPAVAAAILLVAGTLLAIVLMNRQPVRPSVAQGPSIQQDRAPGSDKAVLTLADGSQVVLDSAAGTISTQGGTTVINLEGKLSYTANASPGAGRSPVYNTITVPRSGQYQLVLADGTKVWLDAESSLRFPTAFAGKDRIVELTGQGYFEVAHNASQPFIVGIPPLGGKEGGEGMNVEVLGTHFNINAYSDESVIKTTLLEGKIKVTKGQSTALLKPGDQAQATSHSPLTIDHSPDLDAVMAWKNGQFNFQSADIEVIMNQVKRWYDVEVVYEAKPSIHLSGYVSRNVKLSETLELLKSNGVNYILEGKRITIK